MINKKILKLLLLSITYIISIYFMFYTNSFTIEFPSSTFLFIFTIFEIILIKRNKNQKYTKSIKFLSLLNLIFLTIYLINHIIDYTNYHHITNDSSFLYLFIISITLLITIFDIKKQSNKLNDILTIIICFLICLIHYRYYLDSNFIHNILTLTKDSTFLQNSYNYISQYYSLFAIIFIILFIQNIINNIQTKKRQ